MKNQFLRSSHDFSVSAANDLHKHRVKMALYFGALAAIIVGFGWAIFFAIRHDWLIAVLDSSLLLVGLGVLLLTKKGYLRSAVFLFLISLLTLVCVICLFLDIPNTAAPRSVHQYLLAMAFLSYLFLKTERSWLKYGVPLVFLLVYLVFASSQFGIVTSYVVPDNIRIVGTWINNGLAIALMCIVLHIMLSDIHIRSQVEQELRRALQDNQFELYYQSQVDENGIIWGAEALLRWNHPLRGVVPPSEFIPLAEQTGLILQLGYWALNASCSQLAAWKKTPQCANLTLSVNVSAQQFHQVDFVNQTLQAVRRAEIDAPKLKLELTESMLVQDVDGVIIKMATLKTAGVGFALDDFGTGYSSLNYLRRLPLDLLKIDQSFVRDILTNENDAAIARTITTLGNSLGLKVVAEGVETEEQRQFLIENGCFAFQGYLFSHSLPIKEFESL
jgi:EAL domain-containing protein (putative c-di-GMP-specific phosphodiesterase class I)